MSSLSAISAQSLAGPAWTRAVDASAGQPPSGALAKTRPAQTSPEEVRKAAGQFEAILLRQLLAPSIEPIMSGGLGGASSPGGAGVYGYLLTDVLANSLSAGGGLGLGRMLEKQLSPAPAPEAGASTPNTPLR